MPESLIITFFVLKRKTSKKCSHLSTWCSKTINQMKGSTSFVFLIDIKILEIMHLSMLSPREGGGPRAHVGHLTSTAFPTLGNLTKNLGPRVGTFAFFAREEWDQVAAQVILELK